MESQNGFDAERFTKIALSVIGIAASTGAFLKWILTPLVEAALRRMLSKELAAINQACTNAEECTRNMRTVVEQMTTVKTDVMRAVNDLRGDVHEAHVVAQENREWLAEMSGALDVALGIERRGGTDRRQRMAELLDRAEERRRERRRASNHVERDVHGDPPPDAARRRAGDGTRGEPQTGE